MAGRLAALAIVTGITFSLPPLQASAEEAWYSVYREDNREWTLAMTTGYAGLDLSGGGSIDESLGDTDISFDGTLDLSRIDSFWLEADLQLFSGQHLRFSYTPMGFSGSEVLDTAIVVDGTTYNIGDLVDSKLKLDQYELSYRSTFWIGEFVNVAPLVQLTMVDAEVEVDNQTLGLSEKQSAWLPLPYLGGRAEVYPLSRLRLFGEFKGMTIGSPATIWEALGGVSLQLTRNLSLLGQYRFSDYAVEFQGTQIDLSVGGPYVGTTVRF